MDLPSEFPVPPTKWVQQDDRPQQNVVPTQLFINKSYQVKKVTAYRFRL